MNTWYWLRARGPIWLSFVFPQECLWCGADLSPQLVQKRVWGFKFQFVEDQLHRNLCADCFLALRPAKSRCVYCSKPAPDYLTCRKCLKPSRVARGVAALSYKDGLVQAAVQAFKYRFLKGLAEPLGARLSEILRQVLLDAPARRTYITAVPLSQKRLRWRGFNQAQLLANLVGADLSLSQAQVFTRVFDGPALATLPENLRRRAIDGAFALQDLPRDCERLIIIDDVWGTGATVGELIKLARLRRPELEIWAAVVAS